MDEKKRAALIKKLAADSAAKSRIDPELYKKFNVKRGLRNDDGTGVLVGLTEVGEVFGYIMDDAERVPSEGRLFYQGIEIKDLVNGFYNEKRFGFEETAYLLLFGELPTQKQLRLFENLLVSYRELPPNFTEDMILKAPSPDIMNKLARTVLALLPIRSGSGQPGYRKCAAPVHTADRAFSGAHILWLYGQTALCRQEEPSTCTLRKNHTTRHRAFWP